MRLSAASTYLVAIAAVLVLSASVLMCGCSGNGGDSLSGASGSSAAVAPGAVATQAIGNLVGDLTGSGNPEVAAAIMILRVVVQLEIQPPGADLWQWDCNNSGGVDVGDAISVLRCVVGLDTWPIGVRGGDVTAIGAGQFNSFAVRGPEGVPWAWGRNNSNSLGDGTAVQQRNSPVQIIDLTGVTAIQGGTGRTLALGGSGQVYRWGAAWDQEFYPASGVPVAVAGLNGVTQLAQPYPLKGDGTVWHFPGIEGGNGVRFFKVDHPNQVPLDGQFIAVPSWLMFSEFAVKDDGTIWRWLYFEDTFTQDYHFEQYQYSPLTEVTFIAAGWASNVDSPEFFTVIRGDEKEVWGWGGNNKGQLGNGSKVAAHQQSPVRMADLTGAVAIACGNLHTMVLLQNGDLYTCGWNYWGQLGTGDTTDSLVPVRVMTGVKAIAAGGSHSLALTNDGAVFAWGHNYYGQIGVGKDPVHDGDDWWRVTTPTQVSFP